MRSIGATMASISDYGTAFAALTATLLISASANGQNSTSATGAVDLTMTNARNTRGNILICLTSNADKFPDCRGDATARTLTISASASHARFSNLAAGTYAVSMIHDENANGRMDMRLFLPREGFGFSRNPAIGMGPPRFTSASFTVGAGTVEQAVRIRYLL